MRGRLLILGLTVPNILVSPRPVRTRLTTVRKWQSLSTLPENGCIPPAKLARTWTTLPCLLFLSLCMWPPVLIILAGLTKMAPLAVSLLRMTFPTWCPRAGTIGTISWLLCRAGAILPLMTFLSRVECRTSHKACETSFLAPVSLSWTRRSLGAVPL